MVTRVVFLLTLLAGALSVQRLTAAELTSGPTVESLTPTNAMVRWTTDVATGSRVRYGLESGQMSQRGEGEVSASHEVRLEGLRPATKYYYAVGTSRFMLATNSFVTPRGAPTPSGSEVKPVGSTVGKTATAERAPPTRKTWGNPSSLIDHFQRHGGDFKAKDADDYARLAWEFLQRARAEGLPMKLDDDGVLRVFDPKTRAFAAYNRNGTTKTFFKPQSPDYFERQPGRRVKPQDLKLP